MVFSENEKLSEGTIKKLLKSFCSVLILQLFVLFPPYSLYGKWVSVHRKQLPDNQELLPRSGLRR